jgi:hypothetical protein
MTLEDPVNGRQPEPGARELNFGVEVLERSEEPVRLPHVEASAVVAHPQHGTSVDRRRRQLDTRVFDAGCVLPGVGEQILSRPT